MRTGRSVVELCFSGDCSVGVANFVDFRPRFGVVVAEVVVGGGGAVVAACCWPPVVRRLDFATVGDSSIVGVVAAACLRRVFASGTVCGVIGRLK